MRKTLLALILVAGCASAPAAPPAAESPPPAPESAPAPEPVPPAPRPVFLFVDASSSMAQRDESGRSRFDRALEMIREDLEGEAGAGHDYRVVVFHLEPLDEAGTSRSFKGPDAPAQIVGYLRPYEPRDLVRRSAIWDTILQCVPAMAASGPGVTMRIYSDGDDTWSTATKEDVEDALRKHGIRVSRPR